MQGLLKAYGRVLCVICIHSLCKGLKHPWGIWNQSSTDKEVLLYMDLGRVSVWWGGSLCLQTASFSPYTHTVEVKRNRECDLLSLSFRKAPLILLDWDPQPQNYIKSAWRFYLQVQSHQVFKIPQVNLGVAEFRAHGVRHKHSISFEHLHIHVLFEFGNGRVICLAQCTSFTSGWVISWVGILKNWPWSSSFGTWPPQLPIAVQWAACPDAPAGHDSQPM